MLRVSFFTTLQVGDSQSCIVALCSTQYVCAGKTIQTQLILTLKLNGDVFFFLDFFVLRSLGRLNFFSRKDLMFFFQFLKLQLYLVLSMEYPVPRYQFAQGLAGGSQFYPQVLQSCRRCLIGFG